MGKGKKLKPSQSPATGKHIRPHDADLEGSTNHLKPEFNLEFLGGKHSLSACDREEKAAFADTLHKLSQMTWGEIQRASRKGSGHETIHRTQITGIVYPDEMTEDVEVLAF